MRLSPGSLLARVTLAPVVAVAAWALVAFPLLCLGQLSPLTGLLLGVPAVAAALALVPRLAPETDDTPWWPLLLVLLVTVAFAAVQLAYHSEQHARPQRFFRFVRASLLESRKTRLCHFGEQTGHGGALRSERRTMDSRRQWEERVDRTNATNG